jgi:putative SOS response-associated peptidase YedK
MCGRFDLHSDPAVLVKLFKIDHFAIEYHPSYNIPPSRQIVVVKDDGKRHLLQCRWGFLPSWAKDTKIGFNMINARAETVADKPAFKDAFRRQRCLVVADGFFEWRHEGKLRIPVYIRLKSQRPMGFAGLYNTWKSPDGDAICTCSIITTEANELLSPIHDRMPAIIPEAQDELWLDPNISDRDRLMPLLRPYSPDEMEYYEVSSVINKPENDSPEVIMPVKP